MSRLMCSIIYWCFGLFQPKHLLLTAGRTEIKIAGFSRVLTEEASCHLESLRTLPQYCGMIIVNRLVSFILYFTFTSSAPEVIQMQPLSCCADMWSVGAIILFM